MSRDHYEYTNRDIRLKEGETRGKIIIFSRSSFRDPISRAENRILRPTHVDRLELNDRTLNFDFIHSIMHQFPPRGRDGNGFGVFS
jgi:hypothetical protein